MIMIYIYSLEFSYLLSEFNIARMNKDVGFLPRKICQDSFVLTLVVSNVQKPSFENKRKNCLF